MIYSLWGFLFDYQIISLSTKKLHRKRIQNIYEGNGYYFIDLHERANLRLIRTKFRQASSQLILLQCVSIQSSLVRIFIGFGNQPRLGWFALILNSLKKNHFRLWKVRRRHWNTKNAKVRIWIYFKNFWQSIIIQNYRRDFLRKRNLKFKLPLLLPQSINAKNTIKGNPHPQFNQIMKKHKK